MTQATQQPDNVTQLPEVDFTIANLGNIVALTAISADASKACDAGVIAYEEWQVMGGSILVEHRYAADLIENLRDDGFVIVDE